jgi:hypothetical protein
MKGTQSREDLLGTANPLIGNGKTETPYKNFSTFEISKPVSGALLKVPGPGDVQNFNMLRGIVAPDETVDHRAVKAGVVGGQCQRVCRTCGDKCPKSLGNARRLSRRRVAGGVLAQCRRRVGAVGRSCRLVWPGDPTGAGRPREGSAGGRAGGAGADVLVGVARVRTPGSRKCPTMSPGASGRSRQRGRAAAPIYGGNVDETLQAINPCDGGITGW